MKLTDMKEYLETLLSSFSNLLRLEFTVHNASPVVRVASTGPFGDMSVFERKNVPKRGKMYTTRAIRTKKPVEALDTTEFLVEHPKLLEYMGGPYYSVICYPILVDDVVEGVITTASFSEWQQRTIYDQKDQLLSCMKNIADLISGKLLEAKLYEKTAAVNSRLQLVMDTMQDGILLTSVEGHVLHINEAGRRFLHADNEKIYEALLEEAGKSASSAAKKGLTEISRIFRRIDGVQISLELRSIPVPGSEASVLTILEPFSRVQETLLRDESANENIEKNIIFSGSVMRRIITQAQAVAQSSMNVLITGESGTGKELMARMIHTSGKRKNKPFVAVNCAAIPEALLESELFGYEEGSFTGAKKGGRIGKFMLADHGTLFLDEIGEMPLYLQAKLLRVLGEKKVDRIGGSEPVDIDVRVITATNRNLEEMIRNREFREDLYYRLCVVPIQLPPLRERLEDLYALSTFFIEKYNKLLKKKISGIARETLDSMRHYEWPGNVRELENCIEYMMTFQNGAMLSPENFPPRIARALDGKPVQEEKRTLKEMLEAHETEILAGYASRYGGHPDRKQVGEICEELGISPASYYRKIGRGRNTGEDA